MSHALAASPKRSFGFRSDLVAPSLARGYVISQLAGREDAAIDRSPPQPTRFVLEADL